jgi:hypothetical protein
MGLGNLLGGIGNAVGGGLSRIAGDVVGDLAGKTIGKALGSLFEDGIGGVLNKGFNLSGAFGNIAEKLLDSLLPKEFESVGDLVSAGIKCAMGNYPAAIEDGLDLLKDLPDLLKNLGEKAATAPGNAPWGLNPLGTLIGAMIQNGGQVSSTSTAQQGGAASVGSKSTGIGAPLNSSSTSTTQSVTNTPTGGTSSGVSTTPATNNNNQSAGATAAKNFLDAHPNPEDLMAQIRDGKIPNEVLNSQAGMMMLQNKMHQIQEMNQLMTQMLKAMHDMTMSIIQNMRV